MGNLNAGGISTARYLQNEHINSTGIITATSFVGPLTGNVTGNVTGNTNGTHTGAVIGNVTGNVTGNITGDITGDVTGNADTATNATNSVNSSHVLVTDNESTDEENLITFVENGANTTGNVGLEMDGDLTYNPSTGTLSATEFSGNGLSITCLLYTSPSPRD